jgi:hypothetical protein
MALLFAVTLFVSAVLLFWVQPLVGKMVLPLLGGTPAVWNTCLLFFQGLLLAGYAYALVVTRWLSVRSQALVHGALLALAAASIPLTFSGGEPPQDNPVGWLLRTLLLTVGPPFFVLSASAPLLQKWFAGTRATSASDPYFLYAASNAGSLAALLGFPVLFEPNWTLQQQSRFWAWAYGALAALVTACAFAAWRARAGARVEADDAARDAGRQTPGGDGDPAQRASDDEAQQPFDEAQRPSQDETRGPTARRRLRWTLLAFVPSSLVLGVTTYITTDVASAPLLWVIPLSLYLLSFVLVFARRAVLPRPLVARLLPGAAVVLTLIHLSGATQPAWFLILFHLIFLFVAAMVCHGQLADERPNARHLAEFYLWVAVGGALGGLFNAILAPLLFDSVLEYPLVIVLACFLRPAVRARGFRLFGLRLRGRDDEDEGGAVEDESRADWKDLALPVGVGALTAALMLVVRDTDLKTIEKTALTLGVPLVLLNHFFARRALRFALGIGAVMLAGALFSGSSGETIFAERNFYGTLRVVRGHGGGEHRLYHGSTLHGRQFTDPTHACEPLSYYHRTGPLGSVFEAFGAQATAAPRVAVVGLGTGASAAYARAGQAWTFYEIDPAVARLARQQWLFTYLSACAAAPAEIVLGDARLKLLDAPAGTYGLIVLDAFSSDAVPAHLLTREALDLYLSKLAAGGLVAFHTSNRSLNLERVVGGLAHDAGLVARIYADREYEPEIGKEPSEWVVVARRPEDLGPLAADARWQPLDPTTHQLEVWRDDFSDLVSVFKWL